VKTAEVLFLRQMMIYDMFGVPNKSAAQITPIIATIERIAPTKA
jgi:hypothetical protein